MSNIRNFDAEFCGKLPLHQTNLIQPHGVLLVVKKDNLSVLQASENADVVFGRPITAIVGEKLPVLMGETDAGQLAALFTGEQGGRLPFAFSAGGKKIHFTGGKAGTLFFTGN